MKVVICGAGLVGTSIAQHLAGENNDVTVVDQDASLVRKISETLDVRSIQGTRIAARYFRTSWC
jgi:trk system potassium uptake protein TrkA